MATVRTPFTDSNIYKRVVSDMISMIDWTQSPLLRRLGVDKFGSKDFENWPPGGTKKIEWLEDTLTTSTDTLDGAITAATTTIVVDNGERFQVGHVLKIESEYVIVEDRTGDTLTVVRAQGGTTAATHADATAVTVVGIAKKTGANYAISYTTTVTPLYNYTQILESSIRVNEDQAIAKDYGVPDTMAYHLAKLIGGNTTVGEKGRAGVLALRLVDMAYYGKRQAPTDSVAGMAGGLDTFITTNTGGGSTTELTRDLIHTQLRAIYAAGGMADLLVCSPYAAEKITAMYEDMIRTERSETRGGAVITYLQTPVCPELEVLIDWKCPAGSLWLLDTERVGWTTVRPFAPKEKPSLGDYRVMSVLGEYSFVVKNETSHAKITHSTTL